MKILLLIGVIYLLWRFFAGTFKAIFKIALVIIAILLILSIVGKAQNPDTTKTSYKFGKNLSKGVKKVTPLLNDGVKKGKEIIKNISDGYKDEKNKKQ